MTAENLSFYGYNFKIKALHSLITSKEFLQNMVDIINPEHFESAPHKWIIDKTLEYYRKYNTYPTQEAFSIEYKKVPDTTLRLAVREELKKIYTVRTDDIDYVEDEFHKFCAVQKVKGAILDSSDMLDSGVDMEEIASMITKAVAAGKPKDLVHIYEKDVESRYREDSRNPVPFPWKKWTELTDGGMGGGDLIVPVSGPKGGKSWICTAIGGYAAELGLNVMHYSLELSADYVGKRYDAYFTGIDVSNLKLNKDAITKRVLDLKGHIRIFEFPPGRTNLSHVENHLRKMRTQDDFIPDIVIIDYLEKLGNTKTRKDKNEDGSDVFTDAKGLAKVLNVPIVSPAQANRTAEGLDVIKGQHLAGTYEKFMIADIIFTVAKKSNVWYMMGNRYGDDDVSFKSSFDRKNGHIVIDTEPFDPDEPADLNKPDTKERMIKRFKKLEEDEKI